MKKKNNIYIASIVGFVVILLVIYFFFFEEDLDRISRKVEIISYNEYFDNFSKSIVSKKFSDCNDEEKITVIKKASKSENNTIKVVACRYLSKNPLIRSNIDIYKDFLYSENDLLSTEAIYNCKNLPGDISYKLLVDFIKSKISQNQSIYLDYLGFNIIGKSESNPYFEINEYVLKNLDYDNKSVYEINLLIPDGCDYFISFPNFDDNWNKFADSKIIKNFTKLEAYNDFKKLNYIQDFFNFKKIVDDNTGFLSDKFNVDKIFRDDLKLAKYQEGFLLVTFSGKNLKLLYNLFDLIKSNNVKDFKITEEYIDKVKVTKVSKPSKSLYFSEVNDYFIISNSFDIIKRSIESFLVDNTKSITFNPLFQIEYDKIDLTGKKDFLFLMFNNKLEKESHKGHLLKCALDIFDDLNFSNNEIQKIKNNLFTFNNRLDNLKKFISDNYAFYYISNSFDIKKLFVGEYNEQEFINEIFKKTKIKLNEAVFNKLDKNFLLLFFGIDYLKDPADKNAHLIFATLFTIYDKENLENNLINLFSNITHNVLQTEYYYGNKIFNFGEKSDNNEIKNKISFCVFKNEILIFASSNEIIKKLLDNYGRNSINLEIDKLLKYNFGKLQINTTNLLNEYLKYIGKYSSRTSLFGDFDVESKIKPFFLNLNNVKLIEFISKNNNVYFSGELYFKY